MATNRSASLAASSIVSSPKGTSPNQTMWGRRRPSRARIAGMGSRLVKIFAPIEDLARVDAPRLEEFTVHWQDPSAARPLVQVIDVLGDEQEVVVVLGFKLGNRKVGRIRLDIALQQPPSPSVVKLVDKAGLRRERLRAGDLFDPVSLPKSVAAAERRNSGLGGNACTGQNQDFHAIDPRQNQRIRTNIRRASGSRAGSTKKCSPCRVVLLYNPAEIAHPKETALSAYPP